MAAFTGIQRYLHIAAEDTWGTVAASPTYVPVPILSDGYSVKPQADIQRPELHLGQNFPQHHYKSRYELLGELRTLMFGQIADGTTSLAEMLFNWATTRTAYDLDSKTIEDAGRGEDVQHLGVKVDQIVLEASAGDPSVKCNLSLRGKSEANLASAQAVPDSWHEPEPMYFANGSFQIDGADVEIESFRMTWRNALQFAFLNSETISALKPGQGQATIEMQPMYENATHTGRVRTGAEVSAKITLLGYRDGANNTQLDLTFNKVITEDATMNVALNGIQFSGLTFGARKDGATDFATVAWTTPAV